MSGFLPIFNRLPMVFQAETSECGLACLAMVSGFHGKAIELGTLRSQFGIAALGASAKQLLDFSSSLQLLGRAVKVETSDLSALNLPAILHWDMDHFVVLKAVGRNSVVIHDPAVGVRRYGMNELGAHLTGVALELRPSQEYGIEKAANPLRLSQLLSGLSLGPGALGQVFLLTLLIQLLALLNPLYLQLVIDQGLGKGDMDLIVMLAVLFVLLVFMKTALAHIRGLHLLQLGNRISFQLVGNVAWHMLRLPLSYFERREMGDIVSRFGSLETIRRLVTQEMITILVDGIFSLVTLVLLYIYHPLLASIVLGFVLFNVGVRLATLNRERELRKEAIIVGARQQTRLMENVRSVLTAKVNGVEDSRHKLWETSYADNVNAGYRLESFQLNLSSLQSLVFGIENILIILIGSSAVVAGNVSLGQLMSYIFLKQHFASSVLAMLPKYAEIKMINLELERVADITQQKAQGDWGKPSLLQQSLGNDITLKEVCFAYPGNSVALLQKLNFTFPRGQCVAITGPSGCGKSTLLKLILGLESPQSGTIAIGATELEKIPRRCLRQRCSALLHGDGLLAGDLAYNIHLEQRPNDWGAMEEVCELVGINELVHALPLGFATEIGEMGNIFSAGQRQRILLARALYRQPDILVLDESLSHLDTKAALKILGAIKALGTSTLLVTHNTELIAYCDAEFAMQ
ncbi:MAG: peptidase domain-containing ABC transporter [Proteobacteria bacterium]|nr:peptidase domain-containing ABC transporter [Pseudomonadota bacterium]MDA0927304.1 peptidase domain-containing ABC transporter [Pseudomonadota bacterium]